MFRHIKKSSSAAGNTSPAADDDCYISKRTGGQVLVLPSRRLMHPAADDEFVIKNIWLKIRDKFFSYRKTH